MTMSRLAAIFLGLAVAFGAVGWQAQSNAAQSLSAAYEIQQKDVPESDSAPPSIAENRAVIDVLARSIEIRRTIDSLLQRVEADVDYLRDSQERAGTTTETVRSELTAIAERLGAARKAASLSSGRLAALDHRLQISARLARAIARELAKLDRKLGPSAGAKP